MCGRFSLWDLDRLNEYERKSLVGYKVKANYNAAPSQVMPIVTAEGLQPAMWGMVPKWHATFTLPKFSTINARAETLFESKLYSRPAKTERCLVPANSFFEWKKDGSVKIPMLIKLKHRKLFFFAGIYEKWHDKETSFSIVTTAPNSFMKPIHNRQPKILSRKEEQQWINPDLVEEEQIKPLLEPTPAADFEAYAVSTLVNRPANNSAAVLEELTGTIN